MPMLQPMTTPSFENRVLFQTAYLVNDLEASIQKWSDLFGAGPFVITRHHKTDRFTYRNTPVEADVSYAFGYLGDMMIQFITQHDDKPSIYRDMYAAGVEGYHHIAYLVHDFEAEYERLLAMGFTSACRLYADGVDATYFDTREVTGGFTEIHGDPPRIVAAFAQWRRAHELYRPGIDPAIMVRPDKPQT
jgi:catechol 2,3-dioxygenase-like lactoylglutathione lyase family enzyme